MNRVISMVLAIPLMLLMVPCLLIRGAGELAWMCLESAADWVGELYRG